MLKRVRKKTISLPLERVESPTERFTERSTEDTRNNDLDAMYHCCKWCRHFQNGQCYANSINYVVDEPYSSVRHVAEDGYLYEVVQESLHSVPFDSSGLEILLRSFGLSEKRLGIFKKTLEEKIEEWKQDNLLQTVCDDVDRCYIDHSEPVFELGVEISEPDTFFCDKWC